MPRPIETNDLLFAVDLLITDYSSIVYEYSTLGRPMLFFAYDLDDYVAEPRLLRAVRVVRPRAASCAPSTSCSTPSARDDYEQEKVAPFARRHFDHLDGGSTDRVIELITKR